MTEAVERWIGQENDPGIGNDQEGKQNQNQADNMFRHWRYTIFLQSK